ncbi:hypothetical protein K1I99_02090 [Streptococcus gordonii]|uniref:hypothetical protein n=1 Tax=Streptococcus gordonii TaxID=1302 RepID=UPI000779DBC7|nr:hypothetical protein [Streptococcus gordonii]MBZ2130875.1 hypothetical protein [Streptococcus gordonii]
MKVYQRDGSTFYFIGFLLLLGIFFTMAFASLDHQTTALESQNNTNQIVYRNPISKEDERSGQTSEESNVMLNMVYWGVGIIAIFMFVLGYISNHRPPILEMDQTGMRLRGLSDKSEKFFSWQEIEKIEYDLYRPHRTSSEPTIRILYFYPKDQDASAVSLNLDNVKDVSFNELHQQISKLAPHIKWLFS